MRHIKNLLTSSFLCLPLLITTKRGEYENKNENIDALLSDGLGGDELCTATGIILYL